MAKKIVNKKRVSKKNTLRKPVPKKHAKALFSDDELNTWNAFYVLAEHWQSDLKFFNDEMVFLRNLIDKYFMWLIDEKNIERTRSVASNLTLLEKRRLMLETEVIEHLSHLTNLLENPFPLDAQTYRDEHQNLSKTLATFVKDFRVTKKEIFLLTEHVIESEKVKHLLAK